MTTFLFTKPRSLRGRRAVKKVFADGVSMYFKTRFGSNRFDNTNDLSAICCVTCETLFNLTDVVLVLDNAPCHCRAEQVFEETEFLDAALLRLGQ
ncbi:LOW QUALITY PROTEIN: Hypothetical protein PHPALM_8850 [Phytophthora palmivora]|uniref:Tc1-like transposase DDE domain-containing protein n=1 Tax=Phytophthora palmivora TaxID=4796 RepID=A0A2P4Y8T8_9STRA|nr:LOW QUALITY PROTEIN: Hypothetical protein PHPALM_8850 [Phytophthora palmivora]